jgi:hypothetical protein
MRKILAVITGMVVVVVLGSLGGCSKNPVSPVVNNTNIYFDGLYLVKCSYFRTSFDTVLRNQPEMTVSEPVDIFKFHMCVPLKSFVPLSYDPTYEFKAPVTTNLTVIGKTNFDLITTYTQIPGQVLITTVNLIKDSVWCGFAFFSYSSKNLSIDSATFQIKKAINNSWYTFNLSKPTEIIPN